MTPRPSCLAKQRVAAIRERNRRVIEHRQLVAPLASHYAHRSQESVDDLTQAGLMGLIRAAELYNSSKGIPFEAFARPHVRGAILHHLRDIAPIVRLPRRQAELQDRLSRLEKQLEFAPRKEGQTAGNPVQPLREALGVDERTCRDLLRLRALRRPLTCDSRWLEELADGSADHSEVESRSSVEAMLKLLDPRQRQVVSQVVLEGASYRQLGRQLEMSPMTVQRMLHRGLARLREEIRADRLTRPSQSHPKACRAASAAPAC